MSYYCPSLDAECHSIYGSVACEECPYFNDEHFCEV